MSKALSRLVFLFVKRRLRWTKTVEEWDGRTENGDV